MSTSELQSRKPIDLDALGRELDALRARVAAQVGEEDAEYIRGVRRAARALEATGRVLIHVSPDPVTFGLGVLSLGLYKIVENMELGHNVMHGQYDFMGDPSLDSKTYEWDLVGTADTWKHAHNVTHHTYTNVIGKDDDFGYLFFRLSSDVEWKPRHFFQLFTNPFAGFFFDHAVSYYHARTSEYLTAEKGTPERKAQVQEMLSDWAKLARKTARIYAKEYVFYPALAGPLAPKVALGNLLSQGLRNVWTYAVIQCGHLTEDTNTFTEADLEGESRGGFYLRQILGSSNIEAGRLLGILTGHLSHQIEHHLFPDLPARRYPEIAGEVRRICEKHGVPYRTAGFGAQLRSVFRALARYSLPGGPSDEHRRGATAFELPSARPRDRRFCRWPRQCNAGVRRSGQRVRVDPRKKEERERVAHELLRATLALAAAHGFVSLGLREVSRAADIAPTSFYRYFADMEQLGLTIIDELGAAFFDEWIGKSDGKDAGSSLEAIATRAFAGTAADPELMRFVLAERFGAIPSFRAALERELAEVGAALHRACAEELPRAEAPPFVANAAVVFLLEACAHALDRGPDAVLALQDRFLSQVRAMLAGAQPGRGSA